MKNNKKELSPSAKSNETEIDRSLEPLVEMIFENIHAREQDESDPFEIYIHTIHSKILGDIHHFQKRLTRGYLALIEELSHVTQQNPKN